MDRCSRKLTLVFCHMNVAFSGCRVSFHTAAIARNALMVPRVHFERRPLVLQLRPQIFIQYVPALNRISGINTHGGFKGELYLK
jgi:hypothetical protein